MKVNFAHLLLLRMIASKGGELSYEHFLKIIEANRAFTPLPQGVNALYKRIWQMNTLHLIERNRNETFPRKTSIKLSSEGKTLLKRLKIFFEGDEGKRNVIASQQDLKNFLQNHPKS